MITGITGILSAAILGSIIMAGVMTFVYMLYSDLDQLKADKDKWNVENYYTIIFAFLILAILAGV